MPDSLDMFYGYGMGSGERGMMYGVDWDGRVKQLIPTYLGEPDIDSTLHPILPEFNNDFGMVSGTRLEQNITQHCMMTLIRL
jgi:hypothetical protein